MYVFAQETSVELQIAARIRAGLRTGGREDGTMMGLALFRTWSITTRARNHDQSRSYVFRHDEAVASSLYDP